MISICGVCLWVGRRLIVDGRRVCATADSFSVMDVDGAAVRGSVAAMLVPA